MMRWRRWSAGLLVALAPRAEATVLEEWDTARLVRESDRVVRARVIDRRSLSPDGRNVVTDTRLRVARYLVGDGPREIVVRRLGGAHAGRGVWIPGSPRLPLGAEVVVFLTRGAGHVWVAGMAQGVYEVRGERALRRVGVPVVRAGALLAPGAADRDLRLGALLDEIRGAARGRVAPRGRR